MSSIRRRNSISRRTDSMGSPRLRARSQERTLSHDGGAKNNQGLSQEVDHDKENRRLERSESDPFDDACDDQGGIDAALNSKMGRVRVYSTDGLPTLPRYPVAATNDKNCWSIPSLDIFKVRGPHYLDENKANNNHKKVQSGPYICQSRGCDILLCNDPSGPPQFIGTHNGILGGMLRNVPTFIINLKFPWGVIAFYFEIPEKFCKYLKANPTGRGVPNNQRPSVDGLTPPEKCLANYFMGTAEHRNSSLKLVPYLPGGPWVARSMVTGRPSIIGNKLPVQYLYQPPSADGSKCMLLEASMDIGSASKTAKRIVNVCRRYIQVLTADIGFVIEGKTPEELPEQMLGAIRIHELDPIRAAHL